MRNYKTAAVTGATGKIGGAIAHGLLRRGLKVILIGRDRERTEALTKTFQKGYGDDKVSYSLVDLSSRSSIDNLISSWSEPFHLLVNNAACTPRLREETVDGVEMQWATNVLSYYRLMKGLSEFMDRGGGSRIVNVASYWAGGLDLSDPEFKRRPYDNNSVYRQSKQADRMLTAAFAEKLKGHGIAVNACHPGDVNSTLSNNLGFGGHESPDQGAETPLFLATDPSLEGLTGRYFEHKRDTVCPYMGDGNKVLELLELCETY